MEEAIRIILAAGFTPDGVTDTQSVRIGSAENPIYGGIGGRLATFGGRRRFKLPGTEWKLTIGPRTINIYRVVGNTTSDFQQVRTKEHALLAEQLAHLRRTMS